MEAVNPIAVRGTPIHLPRFDGAPLHVVPEIVHRVDARFSGFADRTAFHEAAPLTHRSAVVLARSAVELEGALRGAPGDAWLDLRMLGADGLGMEPDGNTFQVAAAEILEFPERIRADLHTTWSEWLGEMGRDLELAGAAADELAERPDTRALRSGSLFFVRSVTVHPPFQGQNVGARLLAHCFWVLSRAPGDVAVLGVAPGADALLRYCERLGFARSWPRQSGPLGGAVVMCAMVGARPLRFSGLGSLGVDDGW